MGGYLCRRGVWYYFRLRIPKDIQRWFPGRMRELKISLRTPKRAVAQSIARAWLYHSERVFTQVREAERRDMVTDAEIRKLVSAYMERTLRDAEEGRLRGLGLLEGGEDAGDESNLEVLEHQLVELREDLARGQYRNIEHIVGDILTGAGITLSSGSEDYRKLCREALKGAIATTKIELERMKGHYDSSPGLDSQGSTSSSSPSETTPMLLSSVIEDYTREFSGGARWTSKTQAENEAIFKVLLEVVGDRDIKTLSHKVLVDFRDTLTRLPSNMNKRPEYRTKSVQELLAMQVESPLSVTSVNKYLTRVSALLKWAVKRELIPVNYAEGLLISKRHLSESEEREAYSKEDIKKLLASPVSKKPTKDHPERFWIPLIGLLSGLRLNEICQLDVSDIREVDGIPCFDINGTGEGKKLKTASSKRLVPVHSVLIGKGFLRYVEELRAKGVIKLWPKLKLMRDGWGHGFSKWYQSYNRKFISKAPRKVFHSFRHSVATELKHKLVDESVIRDILGHVSQGELGRYGKAHTPALLKEAIEKLDYGVSVQL